MGKRKVNQIKQIKHETLANGKINVIMVIQIFATNEMHFYITIHNRLKKRLNYSHSGNKEMTKRGTFNTT